jgi:methionyl aminopeptidase
MIKTAAEITKIAKASQIVARTLEMIEQHVKPGISTNKLNDICHDFITNECNAKPASLGYRGFPKSICTSLNHVICHGIPNDKELKKGDIINIDITAEKDGYHGDSARMFAVGETSVLANRLIKVTQECLYMGIKQAVVGNNLGDIGHAIETHAHNHYFSVVEEYCGHGIGKTLHEDPQVLHYGNPGEGLEIVEGMVFTIEPMINAGKKHNKILPDGWTVVTKDRSLSAQWEHTIHITKDGPKILTLRQEETSV